MTSWTTFAPDPGARVHRGTRPTDPYLAIHNENGTQILISLLLCNTAEARRVLSELVEHATGLLDEMQENPHTMTNHSNAT